MTNKYIPHIVEKWGQTRPCPMCSATQWSVNDSLGAIIGFNATTPVVFEMGRGVPVVTVTCLNCGFIALINAIVAGFVGKEGGR